MLSRIVSLIVFVLVPILGVLFWDWDWRSILVLYWFENITTLVVNFILMKRSPILQNKEEAPVNVRVNGQLVPTTRSNVTTITTLVFVIFTLVHGFFLIFIVNGWFGGTRPEEPLGIGVIALTWAIGAVFHIVLACMRPRTAIPSVLTLSKAPLMRIVVMHIAVIAGGIMIMRFDWPQAAAIILVALHFVVDLYAGLKEKRASR